MTTSDGHWHEVDPNDIPEEELKRLKAEAKAKDNDPPFDPSREPEGDTTYKVGDIVDTLKFMLREGAITKEQYQKAIDALVNGIITQRDNK